MAGAKQVFDSWTTKKTVKYMSVWCVRGKCTHLKENYWQLIEANNMVSFETKQQTLWMPLQIENEQGGEREKWNWRKGKWMGRKKENQKITKFTADIRVGGVLFLFFREYCSHASSITRWCERAARNRIVWQSGTLKALKMYM